MDLWQFPDVQEIRNEEAIVSEVIDEETQLQKQLAAESQQIAAERLQLAETQQQLDEKLAYLESILEKIKNPLAMLNTDINEMMLIIIKRMTYRILQREISLNATDVQTMLDDLKNHLSNDNSTVRMEVSSVDFQQLATLTTIHKDLLVENANLQRGDIIIKTNHAELNARLTQRIDELLRLQHD